MANYQKEYLLNWLRLTNTKKGNIMVTMQKRASGSQVRRNSFVNFNHTPFRVMHFRSGKASDWLTARLRKDLFPMLGF